MSVRSTTHAMLVSAWLLVMAAPVQGTAEEGSERADSSESTDDTGQRKSENHTNAPPTDWKKHFDRGDRAYQNGNYEAAEKALVRAAQAAPERPRTYLALARSYFQQERYARAVAYYETHLQLVGDNADTSRANKERRLAAHRASDAVWSLPKAQERVLKALRDKLDEGRAYTEGGGGAWALYRTLLRTGYAQPDLGRLRERLRDKILDEFDDRLRPEQGTPTPTLTLADWKVQRKRLEAAAELESSSAFRERLDRRRQVVDAAVALINGRARPAAKRARGAAEANPDLDFLRWFRAVALVEAGNYEPALEALATYRKELDDPPDRLLRYADLLEAQIARRRDDADSAAERYWQLLEN